MSRREIWLSLIRSFVLDAARAMFPQLGNKTTLLVRETYGSLGAPLLVEAPPESAMILLVRDPGDVVASSLDAFAPRSWGASFLSANDVPDFDCLNTHCDEVCRLSAICSPAHASPTS